LTTKISILGVVSALGTRCDEGVPRLQDLNVINLLVDNDIVLHSLVIFLVDCQIMVISDDALYKLTFTLHYRTHSTT